jgi:cytochrome oxidase Cu insertion factor (SCO1/SenC/PrrC family)
LLAVSIGILVWRNNSNSVSVPPDTNPSGTAHTTADLKGSQPDLPASPEERLAGVGVALKIDDGKLLVFRVLPNSPAALANAFQPDDQIVSVAQGADGEFSEVRGLTLAGAVAEIRGPIGSTVRLSMIPNGESEQRIVSLVRGELTDVPLLSGRARRLPVGSVAPDFNLMRLTDGQEVTSSQLTGQIVVLEFWSTNCGPCLGALHNLQFLPAKHPEWDGKVQILAVSIDETREQANALFREKQWTGFTTVWAGAPILDSYLVDFLPKVYVIDRAGNIAANGDGPTDIAEEVLRLLKS